MSQKQLYLSLYINLCSLLDDIVPPMFHKKNTSICIYAYIYPVCIMLALKAILREGDVFHLHLRLSADKF